MNMDDIERLLDRVTEELGGAEPLRRFTALERVADFSVGTLTGTLRSFYDLQRCRYRHELDYGVRRVVEGFDGKVLWKVDHNGKLRVWNDADPDLAALALRFEFDRYLIDRDDYRFDARSEPSGALRLRVTHDHYAEKPGGTAVIDVDPERARIIRRELLIGGQPSTLHLNGSRHVDGLLIPDELTDIDAAGNETRLHVTSVRINPELDDRLFAPPDEDVRDYRFLHGGDHAMVPLDVRVDHIFADVEIDGARFSFVVDTGAGVTVLSYRLKEKLGLEGVGKVLAQGVGGAQECEFVRVPELRIGDVALLGQQVVAMDFTEIEARLQGVDGILGMDFLTRFVVKLDYLRREMEIVDRTAFDPEAAGLRLDLDRAYVTLTMDGHEGKFQIDTGAGPLDVHAPFVRRLGMIRNRESMPSITAISGLGSAELTKFVALCHSVQIGPFVLNDVPIGLSETDHGVFANEAIMGNAGATIWRKFITWFDFDGEAIYLRPNDNFDDPFPVSRFGMQLKEQDGQYVVDVVTSRSPAAAAGILRGDRLIEFDGRPALEYAIDDIQQYLRGPAGTRVIMRLEDADGREKQVDAGLRDFLDYYDRE
jgi:predicted aspartyl protease